MVFQVGFHRCIFSLLINLDRFALKRKNQVNRQRFWLYYYRYLNSVVILFCLCHSPKKNCMDFFFILMFDMSFYKYLPKISRNFLTLPLFAQCVFESSSSDQLMNTCIQLFLEVYYDVLLVILQFYETLKLLSSFLCSWFTFQKPAKKRLKIVIMQI